jgi:pimeloyl-ACP methyl ester carboxylesterase
MNNQPSTYKTYFIDLPLARLHVLETGKGAPLIMVPATISELENWLPLAQFMAQWFHVYFFELPGHGKSEPFRDRFSSQQVAELVAQLADKLGFKRFSLMGFSFGGILAMRTFKLLSARVDRVVLIAPCLDHRALPFSDLRMSLLNRFNQLLSNPKIQTQFYRLIRNPDAVSVIVKMLQKIGRLEQTMPLEKKLLNTTESTINVLNAQINEILTTEFDVAPAKHQTPCYFAMSVYDPLLRFDTTLKIVRDHFANVNTVPLHYPFHQPPKAFTYEELNRDFFQTVDAFIGAQA